MGWRHKIEYIVKKKKDRTKVACKNIVSPEFAMPKLVLGCKTRCPLNQPVWLFNFSSFQAGVCVCRRCFPHAAFITAAALNVLPVKATRGRAKNKL